MATQYAILSAQIRPEIDEKLTIGFLLIGEGKVYFNYSKNKLDAAKSLLSDTGFRLLKDALKNIEVTADTENKIAGRSGNQYPLSREMTLNTFSEPYLQYLHKHNYNILSFSSPKSIDVETTPAVFQQLFRKYIDDNDVLIEPVLKRNSMEEFKTKHRSQLISHFFLDREITSDDVKKLVAPVTLDLIGMNEKPVYAKSIDLEKRVHNIEYDFAQLLFLYLAYVEQGKPAHAFIISKEPASKSSKQHKIWKEIRAIKTYQYVDVSQAEQILEYARTHGVKPLFQEKE